MSVEFHHIMQMFIVFVLWMFYCLYEGIREAYYYHATSLTGINKSHNLHLLYTIQRTIVLILCFFATGAKFSSMVELFALAYMFPYMHDGSYYSKRNDLNVLIYPRRWKDDSTTSTAKFEIKYKGRMLMFICGLIIFSTDVALTILKIFN